MKALVVYDSVYGNTEKIARAIGEAIAPSAEVKVVRAGEANLSELMPVDLLIAGSPTHGGRPVPAVQDFLKKVPELSSKSISVAAFDTRISKRIVGVFGYAAGRIAERRRTGAGRSLGQGPSREQEVTS